MNGGPVDPHRRTSINQLLNPIEPSSSSCRSLASVPVPAPPSPPATPPLPQRQQQQQQPTAPDLRLHAASWENTQNTPAPAQRSLPQPYPPWTAYAHSYQPSHSHQQHSPPPHLTHPPSFYTYAPYDAPGANAWPYPPPHHAHAFYHAAHYAAPVYTEDRPGEPDESEAPPNTPHPPLHPYVAHPTGYGVPTPLLDPKLASPHSHSHPHPQAIYPYYAPHLVYGAPYAMHPHAMMPPPHILPPSSLPPPPPDNTPQQAEKSHKRGAVAEETSVGPARKRARKSVTKDDGGTTTSRSASRRMSASSKRSAAGAEAAARASITETSNPAANLGCASPLDDNSEHPGPLHPELQLARCMSNRYKKEQFPRCVACTRRWAGDTCRFQGIRFFLKDSSGAIVGASFVENQKPDGPNMRFPVRWNRPLDRATISRIKNTVARALLPALKEELEHLSKPNVICRPRDSDVRATCDTCMTSIFSASWLCRLCGREACADCYATVRKLTEPRPGAGDAELAAQQARREAHAHANPFFLSCTRRSEHAASDFSPTSRFHKPELKEVVDAMETLLAKNAQDKVEAVHIEQKEEEGKEEDQEHDCVEQGIPSRVEETFVGGTSVAVPARVASSTNEGVAVLPPAGQGQLTSYGGEQSPAKIPASSGHVVDGSSSADLTCLGGQGLTMGHGSASMPGGSDEDTFCSAPSTKTSPTLRGISPPMDETPHYTVNTLSEDDFCRYLVNGIPVVITGLETHFAEFTPEWFVSKCGNDAPCSIVDTQTENSTKSTAAAFFAMFNVVRDHNNNNGGGGSAFKLKDWPPSTGFRATLPELWEALQREMPFGSFCRRDGVLNLASHFPGNISPPELGPRMYCATETFTGEGSRGSTRLHLDAADAVNILLYAAPCADGDTGYAIWDLYRAEDAPKIRKFLRAIGAGGDGTADPILAGSVYLDDSMRSALQKEYGVISHRIIQRPGHAVFIPAGVAHQVANYTPCIKVAMDFVSTENVGKCEQLMSACRVQNRSMAWREDSLQLQAMMWFAWLSCSKQEADVD